MATSQLLAQDVFSYLTPEQINTIHDASEIVERKAGEVVFAHGEAAQSVYIVLEGEVALRLAAQKGLSLLIESLGSGAIFGVSGVFGPGQYMCSAQCIANSKILRIESAALQRLTDADCRMGYALQTRISELYFKRYIETMRKLQAIVTSIPFDVQ
jgi:CRP-like cAMP-binding protein